MEQVKLFVGGLPRRVSEDILRDSFSLYGKVREIEILRDTNTGNSRGFAFVTFAAPDPSSRQRIFRALADSTSFYGKMVEVKEAIPKADMNCQRCGLSLRRPTKKIFVGGLPENLSEEEFKNYFQSFGTVTDVVIIHDKVTKISRGFGFIKFDSEEAVNNVVLQRFHMLNDTFVEVKSAQPNNMANKQWCNCDYSYSGLGFGSYGLNFWPSYHQPYGPFSYYRYSAVEYFNYYPSPIVYGSSVGGPTQINGGAYDLFQIDGGDDALTLESEAAENQEASTSNSQP